MNIIQRPSPNCSSRYGWKPDMIVNHITGGNSAMSAVYTFENSENETSAHFIVAQDGTVYQCVDIQNEAWANGTSTDSSVAWYYENSLNPIVKERQTNANLYTISIEHANAGGGKLTDAQLKASIELHRYIISEVKRIYGIDIPIDNNHITGHCKLAPINKPCCPGTYFPYDTIINALKNGNTANVSLDTHVYQFDDIGDKYTFLAKNVYDAKNTVAVSSNPSVKVHLTKGNDPRGLMYEIQSMTKGTSYISVVTNGKLVGGFLAGSGVYLDTYSKDMKVGEPYTVLAKCAMKPTVDITGSDIISLVSLTSDSRGWLITVKAIKAGCSHITVNLDGETDSCNFNVK